MTLPPLQAPRRADQVPVLIPPVELTPGGIGVLLALLAIVFDQATKELAVGVLLENRLVEIVPDWIPFFNRGYGWQLIYNPTGALGLDPDGFISAILGDTLGAAIGRWFFIIVSLIVTVFVVRNLPRALLLRTGVAQGLLLGGAWGNGIDRVLREPGFPEGRVVDFIAMRAPDFLGLAQPALPRYNIADVAIIAGFVMLVVTLNAEEKARAQRDGEASTDAVEP